MHRSQMSAEERSARSRLAQIVHSRELVRGTLVEREVSCGKGGCKCARGEKHSAFCLVYSKNGKYCQIHVPKDWEPRVREWLKEYQAARDLLEKLSGICHKKISNRKG